MLFQIRLRHPAADAMKLLYLQIVTSSCIDGMPCDLQVQTANVHKEKAHLRTFLKIAQVRKETWELYPKLVVTKVCIDILKKLISIKNEERKS